MADAWLDMTPEGGWPWEGLTPGPELAAAVAGIDPRELPGQARVGLLAAREALVGWASMLAADAMVATADAVSQAVTDAHGLTVRHESWIADELAAALHVAPSTALARLTTARDLIDTFPVIGQAVASGQLTISQARAITESLGPLGVHRDESGRLLTDEVIEQILPTAGNYPPARLRERVRAAVVAVAPQEAAEARKRTVREETKINFFTEAEVGMAYLGIHGAGVDILALRDAIRARAQVMRGVDAESAADVTDRTSGQWQVAAVMSAFGLLPIGMPASPADLGHPAQDGSVPSGLPVAIPISVQVVMDLPTALGLADNPAIVPGYGPIDPELAAQLACDGEWRRWVTDPIDGHLLDDGDRRFPGARLRRFLKARDPRCDMPPCGRVARTDADHTPAFRDSGSTSAATMSTACATHNRTRDAAGWVAEGDGRWRSPLGRVYQTRRYQPLPHLVTTDDSDPPPF
jgi:hypothetical protein